MLRKFFMNNEKISISVIVLTIVLVIRTVNFVENYDSIMEWWGPMLVFYTIPWWFVFAGYFARLFSDTAAYVMYACLLTMGLFMLFIELIMILGFYASMNPHGADGGYGILIGATILTEIAYGVGMLEKRKAC